jgi:hypothetical protein
VHELWSFEVEVQRQWKALCEKREPVSGSPHEKKV